VPASSRDSAAVKRSSPYSNAAGLISRSPAVDDERSTVVTLTTAGRSLVDRLLPRHVQVVLSMLFEHLSADDVAVIRWRFDCPPRESEDRPE
jgi:DNA-binding MarR family transcriptional regulator